MSKPALHQVCVGAATGDAITDHAFMLRGWLRQMGFASEIYAEHIDPALGREVHPAAAYRPRGDERLVIYHHGIGSPLVERLLALPVDLITIYHNITPPQYFETIDPELARQMCEGREQLHALCPRTVLGLGDSAYNEAELQQYGFRATGVLPITLDERLYQSPTNPQVATSLEGADPRLLFVGRLVPNKRQEDLIKLFYYYHRIRPDACLILLGSNWLPAYSDWLRDLTIDLGLARCIRFTGYVSQADMITYYRLAGLYVSMSEHEGFGKPFIESMYLGLPVLAYAAEGVRETLGDAGVLFRAKDYQALAELVDIMLFDETLRRRLAAAGHARVRAFLEPAVRRTWETYITALGFQA